MNPFRRGVEALKALNDPELVAAYEAYVDRLEQRLGPEEMEAYRSYQQRLHSSGTPRPEEEAAAAKADADPELQQLYERYLALLGNRQAHGTAAAPVQRGRARVYSS
jgi:hemerythrin-like domain-containing protein